MTSSLSGSVTTVSLLGASNTVLLPDSTGPIHLCERSCQYIFLWSDGQDTKVTLVLSSAAPTWYINILSHHSQSKGPRSISTLGTHGYNEDIVLVTDDCLRPFCLALCLSAKHALPLVMASRRVARVNTCATFSHN